MTTNQPFTLSDYNAVEPVIEAATKKARVARALDDGRVVKATARAITDRGGNFLHGEDIREGYLWVTTREGWEQFWPIRVLMDEAPDGWFAIYDWHERP
jgi:hypothetical protein